MRLQHKYTYTNGRRRRRRWRRRKTSSESFEPSHAKCLYSHAWCVRFSIFPNKHLNRTNVALSSAQTTRGKKRTRRVGGGLFVNNLFSDHCYAAASVCASAYVDKMDSLLRSGIVFGLALFTLCAVCIFHISFAVPSIIAICSTQSQQYTPTVERTRRVVRKYLCDADFGSISERFFLKVFCSRVFLEFLNKIKYSEFQCRRIPVSMLLQ